MSGNNLKKKIKSGKLEIPPYELSGGLSTKTLTIQIQEKSFSKCNTEFIQGELSDEPIIIQKISQVDKPAGCLRFFVQG